MTTKNVYNDWLSRLFHFLLNSPNITDKMTVLSTVMQDTVNAAAFILANWSIDDAGGDQLDKIASWVGLTRPPAQEPNIFTLSREGEFDDPDNNHGFCDNSDPTVTTGGWLTSEKGLAAKDGSQMSDAEFRKLIRQRAASYRKFMTRENLFSYLLAFGSRCIIDDDTAKRVEMDPVTYYDLDDWQKNFVITRGFKPGGIAVFFREMMRYEDSI